MDNAITVNIKNVYGVERIYPVCDRAKLFARLVSQETLTRRDVDIIKQLGYEVRVEQLMPAVL